jgi:hypothetical protein
MLMKCHLRTLAPALASLLFVAAGAPWLYGQIADAIRAHVDHSFIIGNTTLPPGEYTFRMMRDSDLEVMTAPVKAIRPVWTLSSERLPLITRLVIQNSFFGSMEVEFLSKIFEGGSKSGGEVTETSRQEARLAKRMQHATEYTEEQK